MRALGFLADTHSSKNDGSDLPDGVLRAFTKAKVDVIVHLGDIGKKAILDRLAGVAPVMVPIGANKGYVHHGTDESPVKVLATNASNVGLWFNLAQPDKKIVVGEDGIDFGDERFDTLMLRRFGQAVDVVAFAGTHRPLELRHEDVLFVNPGSPTLPVPGTPPAVAILDVAKKQPSVKIVDVSA